MCIRDREKAQVLNNCFKSNFVAEDFTDVNMLFSNNVVDMPDIVTSPQEVEKLLKALKIGKATGPDGISTKVLKVAAHELSASLACLFNVSLAQGQLPEDWKIADIVRIYKDPVQGQGAHL